LLIAVYFLPLFLAAVIGKGQLQNRHPKARQVVKNVQTFSLQSFPLPTLCRYFRLMSHPVPIIDVIRKINNKKDGKQRPALIDNLDA
jgi:hypothetical protein